MPTIVIIDGIRIVIYWDDHDPPHFHAWNGDMDAMFEIATGRLLQGRLDRRSIRKVQQWTEHTDAGVERLSDWQEGDDEVISVGDPIPHVVSVKATGPLTLFVRFDDGVEGEVRFMEGHLRGVFEKLRDPEFFKQVGISYGAVSWPNEAVDLAPDNMHRHLVQDGEWILN